MEINKNIKITLIEKYALANIIRNSQELYRDIYHEHVDWFFSDLFINIKTGLKNFLVYSGCEQKNTPKGFPFICHVPKVNNFGRTSIILENDKYFLCLVKTARKDLMPYKSKYRLELAKNNSIDYFQPHFNIKGFQPQRSDKEFLVLTYDFDIERVTHIDLGYPRKDLKIFDELIDISGVLDFEVLNSENEKQKTIRKTSIKKEFEKIADKKAKQKVII